MDKNKIIELAREAELARQFALEVPFVVDRLERFVALIEREVRGDSASGGIHSCSYFCTRPECIKAQRDELRDRMESAPDVVRQLVESAADAKSDIHSARLCEVNSMSSRTEMRRLMESACEKLGAALAAAKEAGL